MCVCVCVCGGGGGGGSVLAESHPSYTVHVIVCLVSDDYQSPLEEEEEQNRGKRVWLYNI